MKSLCFTLFISILLLIQCQPTQKQAAQASYASVSRVSDGKPVSVMLTTYSTTLLADGKDHTPMRVAVTDSLSREIISARDTIQIYVSGNGNVTRPDGTALEVRMDTAGMQYGVCFLENGICNLLFTAGTKPDKIKVEAKSPGIWAGSHEIHTIPADVVLMHPSKDQLETTDKPIDRMIGADISWLPQIINEWGGKFTENGQETDAFSLLKDHGFNYIRLRLFVNPENEKGYSPEKGNCGLDSTLMMARRTKEAGMKLLLNFHYSDYWADPQQQYKPLRWKDLDFETLKDSVRIYTENVIKAFKAQGTLPDMVQVGNEINHGMLWPDGHIGNPDQLAELLQAGVEGVRAVAPDMPVMMHIALGGQNKEAVFWLDNMIARDVKFDLIGLSYYPRWHGTLDDLSNNLADLAGRYHKPLNVVEYSDFKQEVHDIVFGLQDGKGACIWEPLNWRSGLFDRDGNATSLFTVYDEVKAKYFLAE